MEVTTRKKCQQTVDLCTLQQLVSSKKYSGASIVVVAGFHTINSKGGPPNQKLPIPTRLPNSPVSPKARTNQQKRFFEDLRITP